MMLTLLTFVTSCKFDDAEVYNDAVSALLDHDDDPKTEESTIVVSFFFRLLSERKQIKEEKSVRVEGLQLIKIIF
jgi:hypothetical protein